jgi:riboflavin synthase
MFTGIVEALGTIKSIENQDSNKVFWIESPLSDDLKIDQSVAHDGVCLTVDALHTGMHRVTAIQETLEKSSLFDWKIGKLINLERCLGLQGRLDGHFVQGHVDGTGTIQEITNKNGSWEYQIEFAEAFAPLVIEKGSISLNGTSLTVFDVTDRQCKVAIIPYTYEHTNIHRLSVGSIVNLEFDMVGKYITRHLALQKRMG